MPTAASIINFSHRFLPGNFGIQPTFHLDLNPGTAQDRLETALYFMSWGWVITLAGSLFLLLALLARSQNRLLNANLQFNIGACSWQLGDADQARLACEASIRLDSYGNFRIFKSLGGT